MSGAFKPDSLVASMVLTAVRRCTIRMIMLFAVLFPAVVVRADNAPPVQTFYVPMPEDDYLEVLNAIEDGQTWIPANQTPADPLYTYATISVFSDNTIIYYDHWENGFDASINEPLNMYHPVNNPGGTQIWGDDDASNGIPPGFADDLLDFGTVIRLENSVISSNRTVINFDGGDKVASTKPIALTWAGWASGSATLFAGANEVFDTTFWGTDYRVPVGEDIATDIATGVGEMFQYVGLSIMAGRGGATIQVDADADGTFETTNTIAEGEAYLVNGGVDVGARVIADKPVQIDMLTGDIYEGYESRFFRLLPVESWTSSSTTPVSTPANAQGTVGSETTVWLFNPSTNAIDVNYVTRPGGTLSTSVLTITGGTSGGYLRQVIPADYGARFINTNDAPFYALATIDSTGTTLSGTGGPALNRTWDWGFTLVPEGSLTKQVLVGLGIGRDPTSAVNPDENGAPIWVTPIGNGDTNVTIYVDYDSDPTTGPLTDPSSNKYDVAYTARELDQLKIYRTNSTDQSGLLIYLLADDVKLAAAWGADPLTTTPGQPGLDMGTGIPPLPQFVAKKRSFLLFDEDGDGYISPGDVLEYRIVIDNTGRQPVVDLVAQDVLPSSLVYLTNTTFFINSSGVTNAIADNSLPADPFPLSGTGYTITNESALPVSKTWQIGYQTRVVDYTNLPPGVIDVANSAMVGGVGLVTSNTVVTPIYSRIGDYVWWDLDDDGFQTAGETGLNGVTVNLLTTNGAPVLDEIGSPITAVTTNDTLGNPGWYRLNGVVGGDYIVEFVLPDGYVFTTYNADGQGTAGTSNSTAQIPSGWTVPFTVEAGETITTIDAGLVEESTIGDYVWWDADGDGVQDGGETGVNGVTVSLLDDNGDPVLGPGNIPITTVTTNDSFGNPGYYRFENLYAGDYIVEFVLPTNTIFTAQNADGQGLAGGANSDADTVTGRSGVINLGFAENLTAVDAGLLQGDLVVSKAVSQPAIGEGGTLFYNVSVSNAGPTIVTGITVSEPLTNGLTYVDDTPSQGAYNSGSGAWTLGTLTVGAVATLEIEATVDGGTMGSYITNVAQVTSADMPDPDPDNNEDSAVVYVSALNITKTSDVAVSVQPGGIITYTVVVSNAGAVAHSNVEISDVLPAGTTYVPDSVLATLNPPSSSPGTTSIVYNSSSSFVVPNGVTNAVVQVWGGGGRGGTRTSRGEGGGGGGGAYSRSTVTLTPGSTNTVTVGLGSTSTAAGGDSWFGSTITVMAKGGNSAANNSLTGATGGVNSAGFGTVRHSGGNGATAVNNAYAGGGGSSAGTNSVGVNASGAAGAIAPAGGGNGGNAGPSRPSNGSPGQAPGGGGGGARRANSGTYTGGAGADGRVIITYALPPILGTSGAPPNLASGWILEHGQTLAVTFQVEVDDPLDLMAITNTATVTSDLLPLTVPATVVDEVIPVDLGIGKVANPTVVNEGSNVVFTLSLTNFSSLVAATGVEVTDVIPAGFDFVSSSASTGSYNDVTGIWTVGTVPSNGVVTMELTVEAAMGSAGQYGTNVTTISASDQVDTNPSNNTAQAVVLVRGADLALTKTVNNPAPNEETEVTYTITVENLGPSDTTGVTVLEPLTNGITYVSHSASLGTYSTNSGVWTVGALTNGQIETLSITVEVDAGTIGTTITNLAQITNSDLPDPNPANDEDTAELAVSGLRVTKVSDVVDFAYPGSNITYTIVVTNMGATAHTGVQVTDVLPAGTTYVPGSAEITGPLQISDTFRDEFNAVAYTNNDGSLNWNGDWSEGDPAGTAGPVGDYVGIAGGRLVMHYTYVNDEWAMRDADLSDYESAEFTFDWETAGLDAGETISVLVSSNGADFVELAQLGGTGTGTETYDVTAYISTTTTIRFENLSENWESGEYAYFDNVEIEAFRKVVTNAPAGPPPNLVSNITLQADEAITITFEVTVDNPSVLTQIVNTVSVTSDDQPVPVTATVLDPVPYTDLGVVKSVDDDNPNENDTVVYTITLTNHGPADTKGVVLEDVLPAGVTYVTNTTSQGTFNSGTGVWTVGALDSLDSVTLTLTATVDPGTAGSSITNTATITTNDLSDPNPDNDQDDAVIQVIAVDIGVGKSVSPPVPFEKEQLVYTIAVTNLGPDTATGVVVTDELPAALTYVSHHASAGSYATNTGVWSVGTLTSMQVETLTLTAYVPVGTSGTRITNTATVTAVAQVDTNALNDTASVVVEPEEPPLLIDKTSNAAALFGPGDTITYTIVVSNQSSQAQTGIALSDPLPTGVSLVPDSVNIFGPVNTNSTFLDRFDAIAYTNNNGTLNWTGNWIESEGDGPSGGDTRVTTDSGRGPSTLRFGGGSRTLAREANLDAYTNATLSLVYRRDGLLDAADFVELQVSSNGVAGTWTTIATYVGPATDAAYSTNSFDISAYISTNTAIRFSSPAGNTPGNRVWFDNVQIAVPVRADANVAGSAPPSLATGRTLEPGEAFTVTFDVTVDDPATVSQFVNTASVVSDQMSEPVTDTVSDSIALAALAGLVWFDGDGDGIQDAGETNRIMNLPVTLLKIEGGVTNEFRTSTTAADGRYAFTNLLPGVYAVRWDLTTATGSNVRVTSPLQGGDETVDSDGEFFTTPNGTGGLVSTRSLSLAAGAYEDAIDLGFTYLLSTRAELSSLWGEWRDKVGHVVWRTSSEWGTAGFFLYRLDPETGVETRLNESLVVSAFNEAGAQYELADPLSAYGAETLYRLEEIELSGQVRDLGTHTVTFTVPQKTFLNEMEIQYAVQPVEAEENGVLSGPTELLTVRFRKSGVYGIAFEAIAATLGLAVDEVSALAADHGLVLSCLGQDSVPYLVDGQRILFYGVATDNWYARDAAYQLAVGEGLAMRRRDPGASSGESVVPMMVRFEEDVYPRQSVPVRPRDYYYWDRLVSGNATLGSKSFALNLTGYAGGPLPLKVALIGASSTVRDPDHCARFEFNGTLIGEVTFDGFDSLVAELEVPASAVVDGVNTLRVSGVLLPGQTHSFFFVDWIEAAFARALRPEAGTLHVNGDSARPVAAAGFARPIVLSLADPAYPVRLAHADGSSTAWLAAVDGEPLVLVDADRVPMLSPEPAVSSAWFMDEGSRIDYLIITSRTLAPTAETLADYRREQGLRVGVATYEDISDLFGRGLRTPEVGQWLLAYAHKHWKAAPWMVLLAGNGNYDYLNTYGTGNNHVPPLLHSIPDGLFAADGLLADLTGDGLPDLAIGRLPARTSSELAVMIAKIQDYEQSFGSPWQDQIVLAADKTDAAGAFMADSEQLAAQLPPESVVDRLYLDAMTDAVANAALISRINSGVGFVHYTGHGGRDNLSRILRGADVAQLNNASAPSVLVALSCLVARFEAPNGDCLGMQLMRRSGGGTVAVLAPSGLSYNESAVALGEAFHAQLREQRVGTLGVAFLRARHASAADGLGEGTRAIYNLLGDPALRLGGIMGIDDDAQNFAQWRWNLLAPDELAETGQDLTTGTGGDVGAFAQYAFGVSSTQPSPIRGIQSISLTPDGNVSIDWSRRRQARDLRYRLLVSEDLVYWEEAPPDVETLTQGNTPDGVMENVSSRINRQRSNRLFFRIDVQQE